MKISEKGAISVYGLGRVPVTLYQEPWLKLLDLADIRGFISEHEDRSYPAFSPCGARPALGPTFAGPAGPRPRKRHHDRVRAARSGIRTPPASTASSSARGCRLLM